MASRKAASLNMQAPIRFSLRTYTRGEIDALNAELGLTGGAAFQPAEALLRDIEAGLQPTEASAPAWQYHPDERVQLALLRREGLTPTLHVGDTTARLDIGAVWARAYAQAAHERVAWTPVLDYLSAERDYWPDGISGMAKLNSREFLLYVPERLRRNLRCRSEDKQARSLSDWIRNGAPERLKLLLRVRSNPFVASALLCVRELSPTTLRRILERRPGLGPALGRQATELPDSLKATLKRWALDDLPLTNERLRSAPKNTSSWENVRLAYGATTLLQIGNADMRQEGWRNLAPDEIEGLLALLPIKGDSIAGTSRAARRVLLAYAGCLDEAQLLRLLPYLPYSSSDVAILVADATHATPQVWKACLEHSPIEDVYEALAKNDQALESPEFRPELERSDSLAVMVALTESASAEEFPRLFRKLAHADRSIAAGILRENPERARLLAKNDLLPLMESTNQEDRLLAITLTSSAVAEECGLANQRGRGDALVLAGQCLRKANSEHGR